MFLLIQTTRLTSKVLTWWFGAERSAHAACPNPVVRVRSTRFGNITDRITRITRVTSSSTTSSSLSPPPSLPALAARRLRPCCPLPSLSVATVSSPGRHHRSHLPSQSGDLSINHVTVTPPPSLPALAARRLCPRHRCLHFW
ncbi:hypothetical protein B0H11DRAFT_2233767 [Mycena galericulata]|nr:hypothetical protein B0H11DRAFT_2233767 [Mycena galericulata]